MKKSYLVALLLIVSAGAFAWWIGGQQGKKSATAVQKVLVESKPAAAKAKSGLIKPAEEAAPPQVTTSVTPGAIMTPELPAQAKASEVANSTPQAGSNSVPAATMPPTSARSAISTPDELEGARNEAESVALNIRQYRLRFGGNPVGTNAEIVKELDGENAKSAKYLPQELKRLNENGELIDTWGTPYFFHQLSAQEMETRSAGPDKILWTTDDVVSK